MKLKAAAILGLFSSSVYASYPSGLVYVYALGAATYLIPLIAPLFFLPPTDKTFRAYLLLLVLWYGAGGCSWRSAQPLNGCFFHLRLWRRGYSNSHDSAVVCGIYLGVEALRTCVRQVWP